MYIMLIFAFTDFQTPLMHPFFQPELKFFGKLFLKWNGTIRGYGGGVDSTIQTSKQGLTLYNTNKNLSQKSNLISVGSPQIWIFFSVSKNYKMLKKKIIGCVESFFRHRRYKPSSSYFMLPPHFDGLIE